MLIGYARVSTRDQNPQLQIDALQAAGYPEGRIYVEKASGAQRDGRSSGRPSTTCARETRWSSGSSIGWRARCGS